MRAAARGCDLDVAKSCQTLAQYQRGGFGMPVDTALAARTDERAALLFGQACESGKLDECLLAAALTKDPDDKKRYLDVPMNAGVGELEKALRRKLDATPEL